MKPTTLLVIPDAHVVPGQNIERWRAVAGLTRETRERAELDGCDFKVVQMGDIGDFASLSSHSEGTLTGMSQRYKDDVHSVQEALELYDRHLMGVDVEKWFLEGNHEGPRAKRLLESKPQLAGLVDVIRDVDFAGHGWKVKGFLDPLKVHDVFLAHYFTGGTMGRAIGGKNLAQNLLRKTHASCVVGHSHTFGTQMDSRPDGSTLQTLSAGVFCDKDDPVFSWSQGRKHYWSGCCILHGIWGATYDLEMVSLDRMLKRYL